MEKRIIGKNNTVVEHNDLSECDSKICVPRNPVIIGVILMSS